jgi:hypothetical protein
MKKRGYFALFLIFLLLPAVLNAELRKIVSFGSNAPDYLFFSISGAALDEGGNIYIYDSIGSFIRKYDAAGRFVKEIGRHGQGPGEFSNLLSGLCIDRDLHLLDGGNNRIVKLDPELNIHKYISIRQQAHGLAKIGGRYYMLARRNNEPFPGIVSYDEDGNQIKDFFDQHPGWAALPPSRMDFPFFMMYSDLNLAVDKETNELAVAYKYPDKKIEVFFYTPDGVFSRKLVADHLVSYEFPSFRIRRPVRYPSSSKLVYIRSLHYLKDGKLLLEYWVENYEADRAKDHKLYLLVIDSHTGRIMHKESVGWIMNILDVHNNLVCAREEEGDIPKVVLYRFNY